MTMHGGGLLLAFGFGNLAMLGWLAAAAAPILIHLLSRRRYREVPWAAVEFVLAAMRKNARRIRIEQWLLLAVRTLLILLVVLAVSEPYWERVGLAPTGRGPVHRVLVLDGSFSMGYEPADESLFDRAKRAAGELVEASRAGDAHTLVLMSDRPQVLIARPVSDKSVVTSELQALRLRHGGGNLSSTLARVEEVIQNANQDQREYVRHEVYFFTDLGRTSWHAAGSPDADRETDNEGDRAVEQLTSLADEASCVVVDLGVEGADNLAVTELRTTAPFVTAGREVVLSGAVTQFGPRPAGRAVAQLLVDGRLVGEERIELSPGETASVAFSHRFVAPAAHTAAIRISGDRLPIDNTRWTVVPVKERLRVLCVAGQPGAARYIAEALNPAAPDELLNSEIQPVVVPDGRLLDLDLSSFDAIFFANVPQFTPQEAGLVAQFVEQGGGVVFFLGDRVQADRYNEVFAGASAGILPVRLGEVVGEPSYGLDPLEYRHPIVAPFRGRERAGLLTTPVARYVRLELRDSHPQAEVAARLQAGDPLIVAAPVAAGRVVVVATAGSLESIDAATGQPWTTMPAWPSFLPIVREMLAYVVAGADASREARVGDVLSGRVPPDVEAAAGAAELEIETPLGETSRLDVATTLEGLAWSFDETWQSGIYRIAGMPSSSDSAANLKYAVNVDTAESDLARIDPSELPAEWIVQSDWRYEPDTALGELVRARSLSGWLLAGALCLALLEVMLSWLFGRGSA